MFRKPLLYTKSDRGNQAVTVARTICLPSEHHIRAVEVYRKMSYADALKKVRGLGESIRSVVSSASSSLPMVKEVARQIIVKQSFLAFMTDKPNQSSMWW